MQLFLLPPLFFPPPLEFLIRSHTGTHAKTTGVRKSTQTQDISANSHLPLQLTFNSKC